MVYYCPSNEDKSTIIPENYDFREKFSECTGKVVSQGNCSSGYALALMSMISDRLCLVTGKRISLSAQDVISCDNVTNEGCSKGYTFHAYKYVSAQGLRTEECMPYAHGRHVDCNKRCPNTLSLTDKLSNLCGLGSIESIKREILINGPVVKGIPVYDDFLTYKSGIYTSKDSRYVYAGLHVVKVVGWGEEDGMKYWLIENTWGSDWGENGYGKIEMQDADDMDINRLVLASPISGEKILKKDEQEPETKPQ